jgi:hypothetical protein
VRDPLEGWLSEKPPLATQHVYAVGQVNLPMVNERYRRLRRIGYMLAGRNQINRPFPALQLLLLKLFLRTNSEGMNGMLLAFLSNRDRA